jgi:hypothetical protein
VYNNIDLDVDNFVKENKLIIIFDEASMLSQVQEGKSVAEHDSPIRCLFRVINSQTNIYGVFLSTISKFKYIVPGHIGSHRTDMNKTDFPPITNIVFTDLFKNVCNHTFALGRPLWYAYWFSGSRNKSWFETVIFALKHLIGDGNRSGSIVTKGSSNKSYRATSAILYSRFCIDLFGSLADEFVANHLAVLVKSQSTNDGNTVIFSKYISEPILAEASAFSTSSINKSNESYQLNLNEELNALYKQTLETKSDCVTIICRLTFHKNCKVIGHELIC